jgi:FAD/FMN-containing dehydrogenase
MTSPSPPAEVARQEYSQLRQKGLTDAQLAEWKKKYHAVYAWSSPYNSLRLNYNRDPQDFPLIIAQLKRTKRILSLLRQCQKYKFPFSLRGGGHDVLAYSLSSGVVFDLRRRNKVEFISDLTPCEKGGLDYRLVKVGAGARIMDVVTAVSQKGYAFASGTCGTVGMSLALGSGFGFLSRRYGLTIDTLEAVQIILANGQVITASERDNHDLFWAIRGAGSGNYGLITDFVFKVFPLRKVIIATLFFPLQQLVEFMNIWQEWAVKADWDLTTALRINSETLELECQLDGGSKHHLEDLIRIFEPLQPKTKIFETSYREAVEFFTNSNPKWQFHILSSYVVQPLTLETLQRLQEQISRAPSGCVVTCSGLGGRVSTIPKDATAFAYRDAIYWIQVQGNWNNFPEKKAAVDWAELTYSQLKPDILNPVTQTPRAYVGFKQLNLGDSYAQAYWEEHYPRLQRVKAKFDPENVFTYPQSVKLP